MSWQYNTTTISPTYINLWGRTKAAWGLIRNKVEFKVTVHFRSLGDSVIIDSVYGRWVSK